MGPFPTAESGLVYVDYYSRFFETFILKNTGSAKIIECLEETFARYGIPDSLRSDNGAQFQSTVCEKFLEEYGITHETSTPYWPQANGEKHTAHSNWNCAEQTYFPISSENKDSQPPRERERQREREEEKTSELETG
ncbi:uncharacterized protein K02A2.6-like [Saccostrea cucullata]|uniref:uncharacterized protein K02A2.6-like n=1 Tax=Saccostrea cuccullata TaxID=36930 RepID=UPI002ED4AAAB